MSFLAENPLSRRKPVGNLLLPLLMIGLLLIVGSSALGSYSVTWDEALGDLFFGERYWSFFTSWDPVYLDFAHHPYPPDHVPDLSRSPFKGRPWEYYPVANTVAAATSALLSRRLGWLDPFDGFHAVNLGFAALLILVFFRFLAGRLGLAVATAALGFLFTAPRIVCDLFANIKDFPLMALYTVTVVAFFTAYERGSLGGLLGCGVFWGLTLGTKANALFLPGIPLLLLLLAPTPAAWDGRRRQLGAGLLGGLALGGLVMVAVWPYLWADPLGRFLEHLRYIGFREDAMRPESFAPVLQAILLTTPPMLLAGFALGLIPCIRQALARDRFALLLLAWIVVVLGRYLLPQAVNFDGVRHFLELFPAMATVAGWGVVWAARHLLRWLRPAAATHATAGLALVVVLTLLPSAWAVLRTHPFQIAYWNVFAGGYGGAREQRLPQAADYWGMSYRLGLRWLNENAPQNALLAVPVIEHAVRLVEPLWLRSDITLLPIVTPFSPRIDPRRLELTRAAAATQPLYVMFVDRMDWRNELMLDCLQFLQPEVVWELDGAPVLSIYRYPAILPAQPVPFLPSRPGQTH